MTKIMQNLIVLIEPPEHHAKISDKSGNMCLNRFCIDEDASFELFGIYYLAKSKYDLIYGKMIEVETKSKGKENLTVASFFESERVQYFIVQYRF